MAPPAPVPAAFRRFVIATSLVAGAILVATLAWFVLLVAVGANASLAQWALTALLGLTSFVILRNLLLFDWRGQRVALAPDEALVFVALVALPLPLVTLFAVPAMAVFQRLTRRGWLRGAANVSNLLIASGVAVATFAVASALGAPPLLAAGVAIPAYTLTTLLIVSTFFGLIEDANPVTVFRERFALPYFFNLALGLSLGLATVALWSYHPAATLLLAPLTFLLRDHTRLMAKTDREARVRARIAESNGRLVGETDLAVIAARTMATAAEIFQAGHVELKLVGHDGEAARAWQRDFHGGFERALPMLSADLPGRDAPALGSLRVWRSRETHQKYDADDAALLQVLANETGALVGTARALRALEAPHDTRTDNV